jgi:hypothetical protein
MSKAKGGSPKSSGPSKSAVTGKFVSPKYAKTHPKTTYTMGPKGK